MIKKTFIFFLSLTLLCGLSFAKTTKARKIIYSPDDIAFINCKVKNTTCIVLPKSEKILDFTVGDKDFWIVEGVANFCWIKPAQKRSETNINLVCSSGTVYSFVLREVSGTNKAVDYKVFVENKNLKLLNNASLNQPSFVSAKELEYYKNQLAQLQNEIVEIQKTAEEEKERNIETFRETFPATLNFDYKFKKHTKPFNVKAIFTDGKFTYIKCNPEELPALYEVKDNKPNLIQFKYDKGIYIVPKVVDEGYLQIGKKKLYFKRS